MELSTVVRNTLGIIGFPLTIWNLLMIQKNKVKPPGQIIKTTHSDVHVMVSGEGPVTVILESGFGSLSIDWCYTQPEISKFARVISYDRGNYGWSRTKRKTMTSFDSVKEIKEVLEKLKIKPPYVLVGHSFGGLSMRLFASMYPDDVCGLLLEDSVHETQYLPLKENKKHITAFQRLVTIGYVTSLIGLPRILKQNIGRNFLSKEMNQSVLYTGYTLGAYQTAYREYRDSTLSAKQLINAIPLPIDLPVVVISAKNQSEQWKKQQHLLTKLTQNTEHIQVETGHSVHLEDPKIVNDIIEKLVNYS
ncbi:pimeloyl-ACP methyl ester carboxylesterase [Salirhabdus euzebyi]|uniref:Pimeloyl-ACP methyl ester carboxylesterase n=1 Tax=Salirhabdus euzebyi TaxID=394506 RepID=A0A841Q2A2_9BACI|nr:alpha/beta hydrolase [Salirhabdus euzebyi]MBB6452325.1 pimeloyl-ACP methyl ester carboxylesterase [Salirhabdus euzebyi]